MVEILFNLDSIESYKQAQIKKSGRSFLTKNSSRYSHIVFDNAFFIVRDIAHYNGLSKLMLSH